MTPCSNQGLANVLNHYYSLNLFHQLSMDTFKFINCNNRMLNSHLNSLTIVYDDLGRFSSPVPVAAHRLTRSPQLTDLLMSRHHF